MKNAHSVLVVLALICLILALVTKYFLINGIFGAGPTGFSLLSIILLGLSANIALKEK